MQKFKVGQRIQLEGEIIDVEEDNSLVGIGFGPDAKYNKLRLLPSTFRYANAKIIAEPTPKFSKEQVAAIEKHIPRYQNGFNGSVVQFKDTQKLYEFLDANTE